MPSSNLFIPDDEESKASFPSSPPPTLSTIGEVPHYPFLVTHRSVIPGRAVFFNNQQLVYSRLASRGWDSLCNISTPCYPDLVRKFYAQAWVPQVLACDTIYSKVDGSPLLLTAEDIAKAFNLQRDLVCQYPLSLDFLRTNISLIATALRGKKSHDILDLKYKDLTDEYRFLYEITIANFLPSNRSNDIPVDISTFMFCVMSGARVDFAKVIWKGIVAGIKSIGVSCSPLPYGSLISHLLFKNKVEISFNEISSHPVDPVGSVKMTYQDITACNSFEDIGVNLSLVSNEIHKAFNSVFSRLDRNDKQVEALHTAFYLGLDPS